jgi:hypothetical protein
LRDPQARRSVVKGIGTIAGDGVERGGQIGSSESVSRSRWVSLGIETLRGRLVPEAVPKGVQGIGEIGGSWKTFLRVAYGGLEGPGERETTVVLGQPLPTGDTTRNRDCLGVCIRDGDVAGQA